MKADHIPYSTYERTTMSKLHKKNEELRSAECVQLVWFVTFR